MKPLKYFLTEREMDRDMALKIMGLQPGYTLDQLKARRKELAKQFHTDTGAGDDAKMASINAAYDSLKKSVGSLSRPSDGRVTFRRATPEEQEAALVRDKAYFDIAVKQFEDRFDSNAFQRHFEKVFGEKFTFTYTEPNYNDEYKSVTWSYRTQTFKCDHSSASVKLDWATADRKTVVSMRVSLVYGDLADERLLSVSNIDFSMNIHYEILHQQRKVKIAPRTYQWKADPTILTNPELLFPAKKLATKKVADTKRKFSRRDFETTLQLELNASLHSGQKATDGWAYIHLGKAWSICLSRQTFMGLGTWAYHGLSHQRTYQGWGRTDDIRGKYTTIWETQGALAWLVEHIKPLQRQFANEEDGTKIAAAVEALFAQFKQIADKFHDEIDQKKFRRF